MTIKNRLAKLEKKHKTGNEKIIVKIITDDPDDPNYLIIDPHGPNPQRVSKTEHEAENERLNAAGETVIIVSYEDKKPPDGKHPPATP
jgi:hypothetical protein